MKRTYLISALLSLVISVSVIAGFHYFEKGDKSFQKIESIPNTKVLYAANSEGDIVPLDFTKTTEKVLNAVVHISTKRAVPAGGQYYGYRSLPDPFKEFFKDSPFGDFFGRRYFREPDERSEEPKELPQPFSMGSGSGVIVNPNGYILTNNHVIDGAEEIEVTLHDNSTYTAHVLGADPATDLALIQIKASDLEALSFVNSDDVKVGEWVLAVGNPFSLNSTVTAGIVSAKARNININTHKFAVESFIQTDAAINPGNSGGALVNLNGDLIGINTAIATRTGTYNGYGFAVPSNIASKVVEDLLKYGAVQRGMLGVTIRTLNGKLAKEKDLKISSGVYVDSVLENSAADKAGIKAGDVILKVDEKEIKTSPALQEIVAQRRPGDKMSLTVNRNGKTKKLDVTLVNRTGSTKVKDKDHYRILNLLGCELETIDKDLAEKLDIKGGIKVTELYAGKLKQHTNMREGFIITHVDGKKVNSVDELLDLLENKSGGVMLEGLYETIPGKVYYALGLSS